MQLVVLRRARHHAFENVGQIGLGIDSVEFAGVEKRCEDCPGLSAAFVATEQAILLPDRYRPDRTLDNVRVRLQPPVFQASISGFVSACRTARRWLASKPRIRSSIA